MRVTFLRFVVVRSGVSVGLVANGPRLRVDVLALLGNLLALVPLLCSSCMALVFKVNLSPINRRINLLKTMPHWLYLN